MQLLFALALLLAPPPTVPAQVTPWVTVPPLFAESVPGSVPYVLGIPVDVEPARCRPNQLQRVEVQVNFAGSVIAYDLENLSAFRAEGSTANYGGLLALHACNGAALDRVFLEQHLAHDYQGALPAFDGAPDFAGASTRHGVTGVGTVGTFEAGVNDLGGSLDSGPAMYCTPGLQVFLSGDAFGGGWTWSATGGASALRCRLAEQCQVSFAYYY